MQQGTRARVLLSVGASSGYGFAEVSRQPVSMRAHVRPHRTHAWAQTAFRRSSQQMPFHFLHHTFKEDITSLQYPTCTILPILRAWLVSTPTFTISLADPYPARPGARSPSPPAAPFPHRPCHVHKATTFPCTRRMHAKAHQLPCPPSPGEPSPPPLAPSPFWQ